MAKRASGRRPGESGASKPEKRAPSAARKPPKSKAAAPEPPPISRLHLWQIQAVRDVLFVAAVIGIFWAGYALRAVTVPLLVALLLAYLFEPLVVRLMRNQRRTRVEAVSIILTAVAIALLFVMALAIPLVIAQTAHLTQIVRDGTIRTRAAQLRDYLPARMHDDFELLIDVLPGGEGSRRTREPTPVALIEEALTDEPATGDAPPASQPSARTDEDDSEAATAPSVAPSPDPPPGPPADPPADPAADEASDGPTPATPVYLTEHDARRMIDEQVAAALRERGAQPADEGPTDWGSLITGARRSLAAIFGALGAVVQAGLLAFLIPFYFFFFSLWYHDVVEFGRGLIPERNRKRTLELLEKMDGVVAGFVRGRIVISIIMGIMLAIGWALCGVPYSLTLGLVVGIFCTIPYLGTLGVPIAVLLLIIKEAGEPAAEQMHMIWRIAGPIVVFGVVQLIEGYVLIPRIAGKATNLDPVTILVVVLAGGSVLGVYGMLLAIPVAACGKILFTDVLFPRIRAWTRGEVADPLPIED